MAQLISNGMAGARVMQEYRVWESRKPVLQSALQRLSGNVFRHCLLEAARIDHAIKGMGDGNPWDGFSTIILWLSGKVRPTQLSIA